jgi:hypothetical protein
MRQRCPPRFGILGICLLLALASLGHAQEPAHPGDEGVVEGSEAIPPWGRALSEPAPSEPAPSAESEAAGSEVAPSEYHGGRGPRFWVNVEYLLWWTRNGGTPPLITKGESSDTVPGALGQPYTMVLFGGDTHDVNFEERHGGRFTLGMALDDEGVLGVEGAYFFLTARAAGGAFSSPGTPILAQPFYDALNNVNTDSLVTYPGVLKGSVSVRSTSFLQGAEVNGTGVLWGEGENRVTLLAGLRYLSLREDLQVFSESVSTVPQSMPPAPPNPLTGAFFFIDDRFSTTNDFYGGQLGLSTEWHYRRLVFSLLGKVALGDMHEVSQIAGETSTNYPVLRNVPAGLLALSSNSGSHPRDVLEVVPEVGASLGFRVTEQLTISAGYTFLYCSDVARPGNQIDLNLNPNLIPTSTTYGTPGGPARPAPTVHGTDYWAQGLNVSLLFRY